MSVPSRVRSLRGQSEFLYSVLALIVTVALTILLSDHLSHVAVREWRSGNPLHKARFIAFTATLLMLGYGLVVFFLCRAGYYRRLHQRDGERSAPGFSLTDDRALPAITILVPSYREDHDANFFTIVSAALQDYGERSVVLLIDDPAPRTQSDHRQLDATRRIPAEVTTWLATPRGIATRAQATFAASATTVLDLDEATANLQHAFREIGTWLVDQGGRYSGGNHTERHFGAFVLADHGQRLLAAADEIPDTVRADANPDACIARLHRRLIDQFTATVGSFERKRYVNLGHEANKAANLNAYIGLMGARVREEFDGTDWQLVASGDDATGTPIANPAYVITLDADSVVNALYARHLVGFLETPGHESVAVAQTPYSAIPGATGAIELVAGATTDMQFIAHQGFTHYGATFWVGANAVLRKTALDSIGEMTTERGYPVPTFIQDRTVIEDTESTIDLAARGWSLHNEPHRLAYSATPPDFGTLVIQRRRWANGGLLIFPKLLRYAFQRHRGRPLELLIRTHYLLSPALSSIGMLALLVLPVSASYLSPWLVLSGLPYLLLYGRDLSLNGYRWADLPRIYSFNWLLVPVNIAGVGKSIQQGLTGKKIPFGRTPKVEGRTAAPAWAVASLVVLTLYLALAGGANLWQHNWMVAGFDTLTIAALLYGLLRFVGASAAWEDLGVSRRATATANAIARRLSVPAGARNENRRPS